MYRKDRNTHGGGVMVFIRSDIPSRNVKDIEHPNVESLAIEYTVNKTKWVLHAVYRPPSGNATRFRDYMSIILDTSLTRSDNILLAGDLNLDALLPETRGKTPHDLCTTYDLHNLIKTATCLKGKPSLLDVILTNKPNLFHSSNTSECGLSDYHHIVYTVKRGRINLPKPRWITYRSYKKYREDAFLQDMAHAPLHVCQVFDDPDDVNWAYTRMITDVIDRHAPLKRKRRRAEEAPYMNSTYRKAIRLKTKLRSEFFKMKTQTNWELYRKQRNLCTSMRRQAVNTYFLERCERGPKNTDFWHTIKPFLTNKGYHDDGNDILLHDESKLVHDPELTSNICNDYYVNIASQLGLNDLPDTDACPSVLAINDRHNNLHMSFSFQPTTVEHVAENSIS